MAKNHEFWYEDKNGKETRHVDSDEAKGNPKATGIETAAVTPGKKPSGDKKEAVEEAIKEGIMHGLLLG